MNEVQHRPGRFSVGVDGAECVLDYFVRDGVVHFHHTLVPTALQGRGLAAELVEAGFQWALDSQFKVAPDCSYVASYLRRHAHWRDALKPISS